MRPASLPGIDKSKANPLIAPVVGIESFSDSRSGLRSSSLTPRTNTAASERLPANTASSVGIV